MEIDERAFQGMPSHLEAAEGARLIITSNIHVESGLMNGTQCTQAKHVWTDGRRPDHDDPSMRMPTFLIVDDPEYIGTPFFQGEAGCETWVPLFPSD